MDDASGTWPAALAAFGSLAFFVIAWVGTFQALASIGGWRELARAYPPLGVLGSSLGESFRFRSAQLRNGIGYNNCITLGASPMALRISMPWVFSIGHAPIEVPWSEIRTEAGRSWGFPMVTLHVARLPGIPLRLRRGLAADLARASGGQLALPAEGEGR